MVKKIQLKNGLEVLLIKSDKAPVVSVQMWVHTGSADEGKKEEGISHFIEHLVFKGSRQFKTGEIAQVVEGDGGQLNAYTSFDQTVFYVTISSAFTDTALKVIREMMGYPIFDPQEIDNEREVVLEEIKRGEDSPSRRATQKLFQTAYKKHPYGIPVIGYPVNIKNLSSKKIRQFYSERYSPENMTLVVAGSFENATMLKKLKDNFEQIPRTKVRRTKRAKEPLQKSPRISIEKTDFQISQLYISWPGAKATDKDAVLLDVLMLCLGQGESSRLVKVIRNQKALVQSIGSFSFATQDPGLVAISANLNHQKLDETLSEINLILEEVLSKPFTQDEISKAARSLESERYYSFETVDGTSQLIGGLYFNFADLKAFDKIMKQIDKVNASDLVRVARKYLRPERMSCVYLSKSADAKTDKTIKEFQKSFARTYKASAKVPLKKISPPRRTKIKWSVKKLGDGKAKPQRIDLGGGARLLVLKTSDSPVVSCKAAFLGGIRAEPEKHAGVNELLSRVWTAGTKRLSEEDLNHQIESFASSLSSFGGRNSSGLSMTTLSSFASPMLNYFEQCFSEPAFFPDVIEREKIAMLEQLKNRDDNPSKLCMLKMMEEMFGRHPYHRDPYGSKESVSALNHLAVTEHFERIQNPKNLAFAVVGDVDLNEWESRLRRLVKTAKQTEREWPPVESFQLKDDRKTFTQQKKEQTHLCLAYPGLTLSDPRRTTLDVMQSLLSGQGGRLFIELRDKASLAYTVAPIRMDGIDGGYFGTYIGCSPEKTNKALSMMKAELLKLAEESIPDEELDRAKRHLIGRHDIGLQRNSSVANDMVLNEIYGLPFDEYLHYSDRCLKVTAKQIQDLAQYLLSQNHVLTVIGPS